MSKRFPVLGVFAEQQGLELVTGAQAFELNQTLDLVWRADTAGLEAFQDTTAHEARVLQQKAMFEKISDVIPMFDLGETQVAVKGFLKGRQVLVIPVVHDNSSSFHLVVMMKKPRNLKLHIYPEWFGSRVGKYLFRLQDIQIGHVELDPLIMIKAKDEAGAGRMLKSRPVQEALLKLYKAEGGHPVINDLSIRISLPSTSSAAAMERWAELLLSVDDALSSV